MKRQGNLFGKLISDENLMDAIDEVNRTHHWHKGHRPNKVTAWVELTKADRVKDLREIILQGFTPKPPRVSVRWDASARKERTIREPAQWPDQYIHHALIQVLHPVMMRGMDYYCCGSIRGRGTSRERKAVERWVRRDIKGTRYCLTADIRHFYDSLTQDVVVGRMRQLIKDRRVLDLIERVTRDGISIGAYTSQWFANTILQPLDRLIRQSGLCRHYARYMDNLTIFGTNKRKLHKLRGMIAEWLNTHGLKLKSDWQIFPTECRLPYAVGYHYGRTYTKLRKHTKLRLKRRMKRYRAAKDKGKAVSAETAEGLLSHLAMLRYCSCVTFRAALLQHERIECELKDIVRKAQKKEALTWNMFLAQAKTMRRCGRRAANTAI